MIDYLEPVPFSFDNEEHFGLSETRGLLLCEEGHLVIEYQVADAVVGLVKSRVSRVKIPYVELLGIRMKSRLFGLHNRIVLRSRSQSLLDKLPDARQGHVTVKVKRRDRDVAEEFCLEVQSALLRERNRLMTDDIERLST